MECLNAAFGLISPYYNHMINRALIRQVAEIFFISNHTRMAFRSTKGLSLIATTPDKKEIGFSPLCMLPQGCTSLKTNHNDGGKSIQEAKISQDLSFRRIFRISSYCRFASKKREGQQRPRWLG